MEPRTGTLAKVWMPGCAIYLPFETDYDRDVLFDHLRSLARAHYQAHLEIMERDLLVSECNEQERHCAKCSRAIARGGVHHRVDDHTLCTQCARLLVHEIERQIIG